MEISSTLLSELKQRITSLEDNEYKVIFQIIENIFEQQCQKVVKKEYSNTHIPILPFISKTFSKTLSINESSSTNKLCDKEEQTIYPFSDDELKQKEIIKTLEEWSERKRMEILFDSDIEGFEIGNEIFSRKVMKKSHLFIIVIATNQDIFGGFISHRIKEVNIETNDPKAFVFSLYKNKRYQKLKFPFKGNKIGESYCLYNAENDFLITFGEGVDIQIAKTQGIGRSSCEPFSYEYNGDKHPLTSTYDFIPERIIAIKMY
ncbi:hypothetical protein ENU1_124800 [Entamoeba nuttalli P19]|uniref:TLDc domain-containing protein n=1 Tax=Entamoeba nuttalli (strain P19) TaxID=1076696 RepID=K2HTQ3_ENTNP|nr:hypothetical protein ENU1_124800 [Entamoeba nuttalli P19]EKE39515.1 hypothetical protein ENU1_124800 [Entamoeba nuttalli P19]|eukprot:XP_008858132.1 hypothetical protein ENU1_124800 [Entamoeba nuttalli P19]